MVSRPLCAAVADHVPYCFVVASLVRSTHLPSSGLSVCCCHGSALPTISTISDQVTTLGVSLNNLPLVISLGTAPLAVTGQSDDQAVVRDQVRIIIELPNPDR